MVMISFSATIVSSVMGLRTVSRLVRPKVAEVRTEAIPVASGGHIPAEHYNISGVFNVDVWYDHTDMWASLALNISDGSEVRYERL